MLRDEKMSLQVLTDLKSFPVHHVCFRRGTLAQLTHILQVL